MALQLAPHELAALGSWHWEIWARDEQLPPREAWRVWLICAGRGFGKTRAGAEWVRDVARHDRQARIALVGACLSEVRSVMVEGESGVLAAAPGRAGPDFEPSLRRLTWPNGAQASLYSAGEPESLRGPQHSHAWCDEIAKWDNAGDRAMSARGTTCSSACGWATSRACSPPRTPRRLPLMLRLLGEAKRGGVIVARGRTSDNAGVLPAAYFDAMLGSSAASRSAGRSSTAS